MATALLTGLFCAGKIQDAILLDAKRILLRGNRLTFSAQVPSGRGATRARGPDLEIALAGNHPDELDARLLIRGQLCAGTRIKCQSWNPLTGGRASMRPSGPIFLGWPRAWAGRRQRVGTN